MTRKRCIDGGRLPMQPAFFYGNKGKPWPRRCIRLMSIHADVKSKSYAAREATKL